MGGVSQSWIYWWNIFKSLFHVNEFNLTGSITLGPGEHQITIGTEFGDPSEVFLSVQEPNNGVPTCVGDLNWVAARLTGTGFILFANIKSNSATVHYIIKYNRMIHA